MGITRILEGIAKVRIASGLNLLLITVDSLRADLVDQRKSKPSLTPALDRLASQAVSFGCACSQSSYTWGVFAALFLSASIVSVADCRGVLVAKRPTLAQILQHHGYLTAGFNPNLFIGSRFGYDRGFDLLDDGMTICPGSLANRLYPWLARMQRLLMKQPYLPAPAINRKARNWLRTEAQSARPFFLWLHYMDVHGPYQSKRGLALYNKFRAERLWHKAVTSPDAITPAEHAELLSNYREEAAFTDHHIGQFLDWLRGNGLFDDTIIILCADHGDEFREHGHYSHWRRLYDELIRVPLIIRHPHGQSGLRVDIPVSLVDILPTLVDMLQLETDTSEFVGQSLWPVVRERDTSGLSGIVVGDATPDRDDIVVYVRTEDWKLIFDSTQGGYELYHLSSDPSERCNVASQLPEKVDELSRLMWERLGTPSQPPRATSELDLDDEVLARLRSLGYIEWVEEHSASNHEELY